MWTVVDSNAAGPGAVMNTENRPGPSKSKGARGSRCQPRVVLFELAGRVRVEVVELPADAKVGDRVRHDGRVWLICGTRTGSRVLIAEPEAN
jgi:hypothetical protein